MLLYTKIVLAMIAFLLFAGAFFMVNVPLSAEYAGISSANILLFAVPSFWFLRKWLGTRKAFAFIVILGIYALIIESIGVLTGFPYGEFYHSEILGQKIFGTVSWTVGLAWTSLLLAAIAVAHRLFDESWQRIIAITTFLFLTDLTLDAGMVFLQFWQYPTGGFFYGVPLSNFAGWIFSATLGGIIAEFLIKIFKPALPAPVGLIGSWFLVLFFWTGVAFWANLLFPFLIGLLMLTFGTIFYRRFRYLPE